MADTQDSIFAEDPVGLVHLLQSIERRSREKASNLPQQVEIQQQWEGVVFSLMDNRLVASLDEVCEILNFSPDVTDVPGTQPWMVGIANIRGSLLPIIDLQAFLGGAKTPKGRRNRTLVIRHHDTMVGLLVGEMVGMRHFLETNRRSDLVLEGNVADFIDYSFEQDGEKWPVFSMRALAANPEFQIAAI